MQSVARELPIGGHAINSRYTLQQCALTFVTFHISIKILYHESLSKYITAKYYRALYSTTVVLVRTRQLFSCFAIVPAYLMKLH